MPDFDVFKKNTPEPMVVRCIGGFAQAKMPGGAQLIPV